jgi:hypothetical protein
VAARLEEIALSLRQGAGSELLGGRGGADPLRILITGYAIGYAEALRGGPEREAEEPTEGEGIG